MAVMIEINIIKRKVNADSFDGYLKTLIDNGCPFINEDIYRMLWMINK